MHSFLILEKEVIHNNNNVKVTFQISGIDFLHPFRFAAPFTLEYSFKMITFTFFQN